MKEFYAYHVVTNRPMYLGQHIYFDKEHHNGIWERVNAKKEIVDDIYIHPEKYQKIKLEYPIQVAIRELALEEVRKKQYSNYPSRMSCLYVSDQIEDSFKWFDYFDSLGRPIFQIVKLKIIGNCFVGDAYNCFDGTIYKEQNVQRALHYWKNHPNIDGQNPLKEMLVYGNIEIVEIIKQNF